MIRMNDEIKLLCDRCLDYISELYKDFKWLKWDCDRINDYFALYDDKYTFSFSYNELVENKIASAMITKNFGL